VWSAALFTAYASHLLIHTAHFADNIARPVAYFEPEWLYQRYVLSTMEITFFFNLPMTVLGALCVVPLLEHVASASAPRHTGEEEEERRGRGQWLGSAMLFYTSLSLLTLMHYTVEPPQSYAPEVNFTIAGEGVAMLGLALVVVVSLWCTPAKAGQLHMHVERGGDTELEVLTSGREKGTRKEEEGGNERTARTTAMHVRRRSGGVI
jgi:hypothetical protein